jgi:uncharacterized membrane protein YbhN (UPF0104 family)
VRAPYIDEPPEPSRIHRSVDLLRALSGVFLMLLTLGLGSIAVDTTAGAEGDVAGVRAVTDIPWGVLLAIAAAALSAVPVLMGLERLYRRQSSRVVDTVLAAAFTYLCALGVNAAVAASWMPVWVRNTLTITNGASGHGPAIHVYLATVATALTILGFDDRRGLRKAVWSALGAYGTVTLILGDATLIGLVETLLVGRNAAFAWRWCRGVINRRPGGEEVCDALDGAGLTTVWLRRLSDGEGVRRYVATTLDGEALDVVVLDRDRQTAGIPDRIYRQLRLRRPAQRRSWLSLRRMLEHEALMSYSVASAGIATPRLRLVHPLGPDAGMLVFDAVPGLTLDQLDDAERTDALLAGLWDVIGVLQEHQLAHRRLSARAFVIDEDGRPWLGDLRSGEIAAGRLPLALDVAEMLAVLSVGFGHERTVAAAVSRLGADTVAAALPMLQPVALTGDTRAALRRSRGLLGNIRGAVAGLQQVVEPAPVKLERLRPRTLYTTVSLAFAGYLLLAQASKWRVPTHVAWGWVGVAALASSATYVAAAMSIDGFVPERLRWRSTLGAQVAAAYASLVAPAAVGGVAVNNRYLQRTGIPPVAAATAVGAQQLNGLVQHLLMLMVLGVIAGDEGAHRSGDSPISSIVVAVMLSASLLILLVATIAPLRRLALVRLRPLVAGVVPRIVEVAQRPAKLLTALSGATLLSLAYIAALWASVKAVSPPGTAHVSFAMAGVVFLSGQAVGSAFPTPGGIGTIEVSLTAGLNVIVGGMPQDIILAAVMVFRLLTFWLPVAPGWVAYRRMQRRGQL